MPQVDIIESDYILLINSYFPKSSRLYKLTCALSLVNGKVPLDEFQKRAILIQTPNNLEYTLPISTMRILFTEDFTDVD